MVDIKKEILKKYYKTKKNVLGSQIDCLKDAVVEDSGHCLFYSCELCVACFPKTLVLEDCLERCVWDSYGHRYLRGKIRKLIKELES